MERLLARQLGVALLAAPNGIELHPVLTLVPVRMLADLSPPELRVDTVALPDVDVWMSTSSTI